VYKSASVGGADRREIREACIRGHCSLCTCRRLAVSRPTIYGRHTRESSNTVGVDCSCVQLVCFLFQFLSLPLDVSTNAYALASVRLYRFCERTRFLCEQLGTQELCFPLRIFPLRRLDCGVVTSRTNQLQRCVVLVDPDRTGFRVDRFYG